MALDLSLWAPSLTSFADWLAAAASRALAAEWSRRLNSTESNQVESAVAEAVIWDFIACRADSVRLAETPGEGGIDFEFAVNGRPFLVEVTNISVAAASSASGMPDAELFKGSYGLLTSRIRQKVRGKFRQARLQVGCPLLVAVTTLHWNASHACVERRAVEFAMVSPPQITSKWNPQSGMSEGDLYQSTDLSQSVFLSPTPLLGADGQSVAQAKYEPISGFLLGGFGLGPREVRVFGALNPVASHPFDPALLPDVPFCSFERWPVSRAIELSWTISEEQEEERARRAAERSLRAAGLGQLLDDIKREAVGESSGERRIRAR